MDITDTKEKKNQLSKERKMTWFILTLSCIILWGVTDILYRASSDQNDPLSHYKTFVWIGIVMALAGLIMSTWTDTLLDSINAIKYDLLYLIPLGFVYAFALLLGLYGKKYLYASLTSPIENVGGAFAVIIICCFYLFTGNPSYTIGVLDIIATVSVIIGIILIAREEHSLFKKESHLSADKKEHRYGALVLIFPIIYTLADVLSTFEISGVSGNDGMVTSGAEESIPAIDFYIFECVGFAFIAICIWFYMMIVKKYKYNPFDEGELIRCGAATGETFGTMTFILAAGINPVLTAPLTYLHCLLTVILAHVFLKERLTKKQYVSLAFLAVGIILLGISGFFNA